MTALPKCRWCDAVPASFSEAMQHPAVCKRLTALGMDLHLAVQVGDMELAEAEAIQAGRPKLVLD
jgi:hypothetical protein